MDKKATARLDETPAEYIVDGADYVVEILRDEEIVEEILPFDFASQMQELKSNDCQQEIQGEP